ncbi:MULTISPECIES: NAD-dependent epimerase/dehydratase family protein [Haloferax]|uniref:NAD-dependent epimerase/dehydratase family protein n=1 Tax=Haloferax marinum TaxID=2666143 RepID=A0A6A8G6H8_9EURY|nr:MULTISPECIES: NAD-dependent epimerase/dehydratase family protein [Haloferax]KAB1197119.1 NAD-dependent epimerase/dehydratase family protein [Haloferax sp. CBA1150]MRW96152.1 NAD-dependent epimerase/dehydratase family protein [Haloferax marinum]
MTTHVVVGAGPVGLAVAEHLRERGDDVAVVARHVTDKLPVGAEHRRIDVTDAALAKAAFEDADVVYHCAQPPYDLWPDLFPELTRGIVEGVEATGARLVVAENLYMYGDVDDRITEDLPYAATGPNGRTRAECARMVLDAHDEGRIEATIGRASDFFGPRVRNSVVGEQVFGEAVDGKPARVLGKPKLPHTYTYVPDFARALVLLGERDDALGEAWHVPNPETVSTRQFVELVYDAAEVDPVLPRIVYLSGPLLTLGGAVSSSLDGFVNSPPLKEFVERRYSFEAPYIVDDSKFRNAFGDAVTATSLETAIDATVAWYREQEPVTGPIHIETGEEQSFGATHQ